jgi:hypothetical protein
MVFRLIFRNIKYKQFMIIPDRGEVIIITREKRQNIISAYLFRRERNTGDAADLIF